MDQRLALRAAANVGGNAGGLITTGGEAAVGLRRHGLHNIGFAERSDDLRSVGSKPLRSRRTEPD